MVLAIVSLFLGRANRHRKRAEEALLQAHDELEMRVEERTAALAEANESLRIEIAERVRAEVKIAASLKEKEVLLREIHHRVKNNMQVIVSLLRMHLRRINDRSLVQVFEECRDRVNAMSLIHEALYQSEDLARIDFEIYLKKLCRNLSQAHGTEGKGMAVTVERSNMSLGMDQGIAVGMVICELVSNAFKHAFPLGQVGMVSVSLSGLRGKAVELIVEDDGKGRTPFCWTSICAMRWMGSRRQSKSIPASKSPSCSLRPIVTASCSNVPSKWVPSVIC